MMFEQGEQIKRVQECKRDIEAEAKRLQKKITTLQNFRNATSEFIKANYLHWFDNKIHREMLFIALGGLSLEIPELQKRYEDLLYKIAEEE